MTEGKWVLMDYEDVVVHIFLEPVRAFLRFGGALDRCPRMDLQKEGMLVKEKVKPQVVHKVVQKKESVSQKKEADKLDKKAIAKFKKILLKEREQIVGDVKQIVESSKEMGQDGIQDIGMKRPICITSKSCLA